MCFCRRKSISRSTRECTRVHSTACRDGGRRAEAVGEPRGGFFAEAADWGTSLSCEPRWPRPFSGTSRPRLYLRGGCAREQSALVTEHGDGGPCQRGCGEIPGCLREFSVSLRDVEASGHSRHTSDRLTDGTRIAVTCSWLRF